MPNIILYSTGCPQCKILKKKLQEKGILFTENNNEQQMLSMNFVKVPVLEIDGERLDFTKANKWINDYNAEG